MSATKLLVTGLAPNMAPSELAQLFRSYVDLLRIAELSADSAIVYVPDRSHAVRAVRELNFRVVRGRVIQVRISGNCTAPAGVTLSDRVLASESNVQYCTWNFYVGNIDPAEPFGRVVELFRRYGTPGCWQRAGSRTTGLVQLSTDLHWMAVAHGLSGAIVGGHRITVKISHLDVGPGAVLEKAAEAAVNLTIFVVCVVCSVWGWYWHLTR